MQNQNKRGKHLDLVIGGPDMSGTSTQIKDVIKYFQENNLKVRDLRGTETDALFHSQKFQKEIEKIWGQDYMHFSDFLETADNCMRSGASTVGPRDFLFYAHELLSGGGTNQDLRVASMVDNEVTTYIDPNSADVWIMEEPTKRGAGQINRVIEQNRSKFGDKMNPFAAALTHQAYRSEEFFRFRKPIGENDKGVVRSRSEESACYQIYDKTFLPNGIKKKDYLRLPGHEVAFRNPPTNIFVVCGPGDWTEKDYLDLKKQRTDGRNTDDHESNAGYQVLVNNRYATDWLEGLYEEGCKMHGGKVPEITRFSFYDSKDKIKEKMYNKLEEILD